MKPKKIYHVLLAGLLTFLTFFTSTAQSSPCNLQVQTTKNMQSDFGAVGNGIIDDSPAFQRASDWINANWSNSHSIKVVVPPGTYLVGHQIKKGDTWNYVTGTISNQLLSYHGVRVFDLVNAKNVIIEGAANYATKIIYKNGLIYGGYNLVNDQPCNAKSSSCGNSCPRPQLDIATVGAFAYLQECNCITINNFWVEGRYNMCKRQGPVGECASIQLEYDGILLNGGSNITISDVTCANFGRDGIMTYEQNPSKTEVTNLSLNNFIASGNGRQGFSIISGSNFSAVNCDFILTGNIKDGAIYTGNPQAGLDIEPDDTTDRFNNINFTNCRFSRNAWCAFVSDNIDPQKHKPANITFDGCFFSSLTSWALWPNKLATSVIKNSTIVGAVTHISGMSSSDHLLLDNNTFTDWFGNWDTPVSTWSKNNLAADYLLNLPNTDNTFYDFTNNNINIYHSKLIYTDQNTTHTAERIWSNNIFTFNGDALRNGYGIYTRTYDSGSAGHLGHFKNCTLNSNIFVDATPSSTAIEAFWIGVKGLGYNTLGLSIVHPSDNVTNGLNNWGPWGNGSYTWVKYNPAWISGYFRIPGNW